MSIIQVGDELYSPFFGQYITVVKITSDNDWEFKIQGHILKAQVPLSYFENKKKGQINKEKK